MRGLSVWAFLCVAWACGGDDDDGGGDGSTADSGSGGAADASGGGAADASGGTDGGRHDASSPDGGRHDGATIDASAPADGGSSDAASGSGLVSYTVNVNPAWPRAGNPVFFLRADDSVIDIVLTDDNGRAEAMVDEPVTVVVDLLRDEPGLDSVQAFLEVPPGTDIRYGSGIPDRSATLVATGPVPENPFGFGVETSCGRLFRYGVEPTVSVDLAFCPPVIDVVWVAGATASGQQATFSVFQPSVPVDAGSITVKGTLRPDVVQNTRIAGIPDDVPTADLTYWVRGAYGRVQEGGFYTEIPVEGGAVAIVDPMHDLRGLGLRGRLAASWYQPLSETAFDATVTVPHDGATDVNVAAFLPPVLRDSVLDLSTGIWAWSEDGPNTPTAIQGFVFIGVPGRTRSWRIIAPHRGTSVRVPRLPPPYEGLNLAPDSPVLDLQMQLVTHSRGYGPIVSDIEGVLYDAGEVGDVTALEYGFGDVVQ